MTTIAALTTGAMLFGFTNLAFAAETEAPGGRSDITIVESTPGEKGNPATSAPAAVDDVDPDDRQ